MKPGQRFRQISGRKTNPIYHLGTGVWTVRGGLYAKLAAMRRISIPTVLLLLVFSQHPGIAYAQTFESVGTRAAGMGGAFVAVADDASAVYWNPAGLALGGSYFSLAIDGGMSEADPAPKPYAGRQSGTLIALTTLPLGLSYYRQSSTHLTSPSTLSAGPPVQVERLTTHHAGLTFVQSVTSQFALATTVKAVRGIASSGVVIDGNRDDLLESDAGLPDNGSTEFSADIGVMVSLGSVRAGVTIRNVNEPDFDTPSGTEIELKRQSRAGIAYVGTPGVILAADIDLERVRGSLGEVRNLAGGAEMHLTSRVFVRGGMRFNTLSDEPGGFAPVGSVGGTVATFKSLLIDGQYTFGSESGDRGWGIAARLVY